MRFIALSPYTYCAERFRNSIEEAAGQSYKAKAMSGIADRWLANQHRKVGQRLSK
jgi:hypothetical protein